MQRARLAIAALGAIALTSLASCGGSDGSESPENERTITVTGVGRVSGTPDVMQLKVGVSTIAPTARAALDEVNTSTGEVIDTLKERGVQDEDLQTTRLSIAPLYDEERIAITGYAVGNALTADVHDVEAAGEIIDAVASAAGDTIRLEGVSFSIADESDLLRDARDDAVTRAREQAEELAAAAGVSLGKVRSVDDASMAFPEAQFFAGAADADRAAAVPIEPGSQELTMAVQVVYEIT